MSELDNLIACIELEFPHDVYRYKRHKDTQIVSIGTEDIDIAVLNIHDAILYILQINKTNDITGTSIITKIISIAKHANVNKITLIDNSQIACENNESFKLYMFHILSTGMSWYNKMGFFSLNHERDYDTNKRHINKNFIKFIKECASKCTLYTCFNKESRETIYNIQSFILTFTELFSDDCKLTSDMTTIEIFSILKNVFKNIKTLKHKRKVKWLLETIKLSKYLIGYNKVLSHDIK